VTYHRELGRAPLLAATAPRTDPVATERRVSESTVVSDCADIWPARQEREDKSSGGKGTQRVVTSVVRRGSRSVAKVLL
jgi:hypothetical protein